MQKDDFLIHKESFIKSKRENILQHYDFHPKVTPHSHRNLAREPMELFTRQRKKEELENGEPSKR